MKIKGKGEKEISQKQLGGDEINLAKKGWWQLRGDEKRGRAWDDRLKLTWQFILEVDAQKEKKYGW